ncbi:MAG: GNAT family N-acetyltransferase [Kangiellaceae bacterium]|nr:GNAT family N-acetyltransferase [Kangiellaceae bacterium]
MSLTVQEIPLEQVYALRNLVLRPNQPISSCHYEEDQFEGVFHMGAFVEQDLKAIASFYPQNHSKLDAQNPIRLRGMACDPCSQGQGLGTVLLRQSIAECQYRGFDLLWCNARTSAQQFYKRLDFAIKGNEFMLSGIGPHYLMYKAL